jgi:lysophospholipase L1-like esterase
MGTNEAANQAVGSAYDARERIDLLMHAIGKAPVLWPTVKTTQHSGYYDDTNMQKFNDALVQACKRYPNLRVYDWASEVKDNWFSSDGIHFTSAGYRQRAYRIAQALARAYPRDSEASPDCVVHSR